MHRAAKQARHQLVAARTENASALVASTHPPNSSIAFSGAETSSGDGDRAFINLSSYFVIELSHSPSPLSTSSLNGATATQVLDIEHALQRRRPHDQRPE